MIYSNLINEARDIKGQSFVGSLATTNKKALKCHFELNFKNF